MDEIKKRYGSSVFYSLLDEMAKTHSDKSHDYATNHDPAGNYHFAGSVANMFSHSSDDAGFAGRLAEKMYRLSVLGKRGTAPKNESIDDTERDIAVIAVLWMASRRESRMKSDPLAEQKAARVNQQYATAAPDDVKNALLEVAQLAGELTLNDKSKLIEALLGSIIAAAMSSGQNRKSPLSNSTGE